MRRQRAEVLMRDACAGCRRELSRTRQLGTSFLMLVLRIACTFLILISAAVAADWPQWRGPRGDGTSEETKFPTRWTATDGVRWRAEIPGKGHASPVVCKGRIFLAA